MDRLWAPWRAQYIREASATELAGDEPGCFLCRYLGAPEVEDRANHVVWRRAHSFVVLNRYPYNNGHLLIAPRVHKGSLGDLTGADLTEPLETMQRAIAVLDRVLRPQGYNVGLNLGRSAGAGLPGHLHWHVVPRWDGDTNFMPVVGRAKVIVESLDELHDRFVAALRGVLGELGASTAGQCASPTRTSPLASLTT
jgi:ATP adenylyltransferase